MSGHMDPYAFLPAPRDNLSIHATVSFSDGREVVIVNTPDELAAHLESTGGSVITRFPPEPNGHLHVGHAKAMFVNFGMAQQYGGGCYLRYDDTNPETEKQEFLDGIRDIVEWMGWKPSKITHTSDYFAHLHRLAMRLIEQGDAYVCHQTAEEIKWRVPALSYGV